LAKNEIGTENGVLLFGRKQKRKQEEIFARKQELTA